MGRTGSPRGPYRATAAKRAEIVQAAYEVFAANGYQAASLRAIAARAEISHSGLLHHFPSKEALLMAVLAERENDDRGLLRDPPVETLDDLARSLLAVMASYQKTPELIQLWTSVSVSASRTDHPAHDFVVRRYTRWADELAENLERIKARGAIAADVDTNAAAVAIVALAQGLQLRRLTDAKLDPGPPILEVLNGLRDGRRRSNRHE